MSGLLDQEPKNPPPSPKSLFNNFGTLFRPSILSSTPRPRLSPTAYLDGLRGFAAFLVYLQHHNGWAHASLNPSLHFESAFGYNSEYYFAALPGIRLFFSGGHAAVCVFFVISGYVLSAKPLALIQAGEQLKLADNLASALFRRWLRLFAPLVGTTFLYMLSWHVFGLATGFPQHQESLTKELWSWASEVKNFTYIYRQTSPFVHEDAWLTYNFHLWSIPTEFRGSMVVYTTLLAVSRFTRNARLFTFALCIFYFLYLVDGWFCAMFISGMLICDLELLAKAGNLPAPIARLAPHKTKIFTALFAFAIYLSGVPSYIYHLEILLESPGWYFLYLIGSTSVVDYKWFYLTYAAAFIVASIPHLPPLKTFFESRFNQYLGRISFALYLVHGPILWTLGDRLYLATGWTRENNVEGLRHWFNLMPLSKAGPLGIDAAWLVPQIILLPFTFWVAECVTRVFDKPSIKLAQWVYGLGLAPNL